MGPLTPLRNRLLLALGLAVFGCDDDEVSGGLPPLPEDCESAVDYVCTPTYDAVCQTREADHPQVRAAALASRSDCWADDYSGPYAPPDGTSSDTPCCYCAPIGTCAGRPFVAADGPRFATATRRTDWI